MMETPEKALSLYVLEQQFHVAGGCRVAGFPEFAVELERALWALF